MKNLLVVKIKSRRDWLLIIFVFALLLLALSIIAWQIYLSNKIGGGYIKIVEDNISVSVKSIDLKRLDASVNLLDIRSERFSALSRETLRLIDPGK